MLTDIIDKINQQQNAIEGCTNDHSAILHISSHGAFDTAKKQFYLAIENTKSGNAYIGEEGKLFEKEHTDVLNERGKNYDDKNSSTKVSIAGLSKDG